MEIGVPSWVEARLPEPAAALDFYGPLLGWTFEERDAGYHVARSDGHDVAGIAAGIPSWNTYVRVEDVGAAAARAEAAGATVLAGPVAAPVHGRLAVFADPAGAPLGVTLQARAERVNAPGAWVMSSLHTSDPAGAVGFYGELFGWRAQPYGPVTLFLLDGYEGGVEGQPIPRETVAVMAPPSPDVPTHWNVGFIVIDADAIAAQAIELGGRVLMGPLDTPGFRSAVIADPQGAAFTANALAA